MKGGISKSYHIYKNRLFMLIHPSKFMTPLFILHVKKI